MARRIVVLGAREGVGATSTAVALAVTLAESGAVFGLPGGAVPGGEGHGDEGHHPGSWRGPSGREPAGPAPDGPDGGVVVVEATPRPAARTVLAGLVRPGGSAGPPVDVRRYCPASLSGEAPWGAAARHDARAGAGTAYGARTELLARRRAWLLTDAGPGIAREDPDGIVATADDLVLVTTSGVAGATAAQETLEALRARGAGALAGRCVLVVTGVRDAARPVGRRDMRAFFEQCCGAVVTLPRAAAAGWPWSRRALRELVHLLMPVTAEEA